MQIKKYNYKFRKVWIQRLMINLMKDHLQMKAIPNNKRVLEMILYVHEKNSYEYFGH